MYKIYMEKIGDLLGQMSANLGGELYLPLRQGSVTNFDKWHEDAIVDFETLKTINTPKDLILPQYEDLYSAKMSKDGIEILPAAFVSSPFVIFGVRACDAAAIGVLDNTYLNNQPIDNFYAARRENACIVALACGEPKATCFCNIFQINAAKPQGDVIAWIVGDFMQLEAQNDKGAALLAELSGLLEPSNDDFMADFEKSTAEKLAKQPYATLNLEAFTPDRMMEIFNSTGWEQLHRPCIGCGTCTYTCPTCSCYDVRDYKTKDDGIAKFRCWDSCMFPNFTLMAHGNNRVGQKERFRQRFMHKLLYHPENFGGQFGCVGCGRCINKCPASLNIVKIIKTLGEVAANA